MPFKKLIASITVLSILGKYEKLPLEKTCLKPAQRIGNFIIIVKSFRGYVTVFPDNFAWYVTFFTSDHRL